MFVMNHEAESAFVHRLADRASAIALRHLAAAEMTIETKADGSPVTDADLEIEKALRSMIGSRYPDDAFLGEEHGGHDGGPGGGHRRWIVDAIDGTASFLAGEPEWSTLIALESNQAPSLGLVSAPALQRRWWATTGRGAWTRPNDPAARPERLAVTNISSPKDATLGIWPPPHRLTAPHSAIAASLATSMGHVLPPMDWRSSATPPSTPAKPSAGSGTCHGALLVATARLDALLLLGAGPWDVAAVVPIVEEAGGRFSDLSSDQHPGVALFTNAHLHEYLLGAARAQ
jgi:histidinol-phosphatase